MEEHFLSQNIYAMNKTSKNYPRFSGANLNSSRDPLIRITVVFPSWIRTNSGQIPENLEVTTDVVHILVSILIKWNLLPPLENLWLRYPTDIGVCFIYHLEEHF